MFDLKPINEEQKARSNKYRVANFDRLEVYLPKGQRRAIKAHAKQYQLQAGEPGKAGYSPVGSVSAFVNRAIKGTMALDIAMAEIAGQLAAVPEKLTEEANEVGLGNIKM